MARPSSRSASPTSSSIPRFLDGFLLHPPDVKDDTLEVGREGWRTDEEAVVQPGIFAVGRRLKLWGSLEIERGFTVGILAGVDDAAVTDVDIDAVVRLDAGTQWGQTPFVFLIGSRI